MYDNGAAVVQINSGLSELLAARISARTSDTFWVKHEHEVPYASRRMYQAHLFIHVWFSNTFVCLCVLSGHKNLP